MAFCIILFFISLTTTVFSQVPSKTKLIFTHVLYRHGDRSPSRTYPKDPYQEDAWPAGFAQLTKKGMRVQYELGEYLRKKYGNLLNSTYNRLEIYARSTDKDRALQSAVNALAGLYPPQVQSKCFDWHDFYSVPVHAVADEEDILLQTDTECPEYTKAFHKDSDEYIKSVDEKHKNLYAFLKEKTGLKEVDLMGTIGDIAGPLYRERAQGWPLPDWADHVWNNSTNETIYKIVNELKRISKIVHFDSHEEARFTSGYLLGDMINRMKEKTAGRLKHPTKMVMYSAHDDTIIGLLYAMNLSNHKIVPYSSCVMIDLHESVSEKPDYFVSVDFRNDTSRDPYRLLVPGCPENNLSLCQLNTFEQVLEKAVLFPKQAWVSACFPNGAHSNASYLNATNSNAATRTHFHLEGLLLCMLVWLLCSEKQ